MYLFNKINAQVSIKRCGILHIDGSNKIFFPFLVLAPCKILASFQEMTFVATGSVPLDLNAGVARLRKLQGE